MTFPFTFWLYPQVSILSFNYYSAFALLLQRHTLGCPLANLSWVQKTILRIQTALYTSKKEGSYLDQMSWGHFFQLTAHIATSKRTLILYVYRFQAWSLSQESLSPPIQSPIWVLGCGFLILQSWNNRMQVHLISIFQKIDEISCLPIALLPVFRAVIMDSFLSTNL